MKLFDKEELSKKRKYSIEDDKHVEDVNSTVTFNGNGSRTKNETDVRTIAKISYGNFIGQYKYLFSEIIKSVENIDDYVVLCPLYQGRDKRVNKWEHKFDYQPAVTGKSKTEEPDSIDGYRLETMNREVAEELNIRVDIKRVSSVDEFPRFKFGWAVIQDDYVLPYNEEHDFKSVEEDYNRRIMVVVLERKDHINTTHVNNHFHCETDIIGIYRKPLRDIWSELNS
jgi:hypothetical protein